MSKSCIFNNNKLCDDCGECDICDLDSSKKCNSCGKCINMSDFDMKVVNIDEIQEEEVENDIMYFEEINENPSHEAYTEDVDNDLNENLEPWELIDDIEGINEILDDKEKFKNRAVEIFPGLIIIKE